MSQKRTFSLAISIGILFTLLFAIAAITSPVSAATILVNSYADNEINDSLCTLREAIIAANTETAYNGCQAGSGTDTISLPAGTYTLQGQLPDISSQIIIIGSSAANTIIQASVCNPITTPGGCTPANYGIFRVNSESKLNISKLTIRHGNAIAGGGVQNSGNLEIVDSILSGNLAQIGGAINNASGYVVIRNSDISNNRATDPISNLGWGGGINNYQGSVYVESSMLNKNISAYYGGGINNDQGLLNILETTISENKAGWGGGVYTFAVNTFNIQASTISGNFAEYYGGGIYINGILNARDNTFSGNTAHEGGGLYANAGYLYLQSNTFSENKADFFGGVSVYGILDFVNTIITNSVNSQDCFVWTDGSGSIGTNINNFVGDGSCSDSGINFLSGDPKLGPLGNYGGPTRTHALRADSPAIDSGNCDFAESYDQRGRQRPIGASCDIGAFEFNPAFDGYQFIFLPLIIR